MTVFVSSEKCYVLSRLNVQKRFVVLRLGYFVLPTSQR